MQDWDSAFKCLGAGGLSDIVNFFDLQGRDLGNAGRGHCVHMSGCLGLIQQPAKARLTILLRKTIYQNQIF